MGSGGWAQVSSFVQPQLELLSGTENATREGLRRLSHQASEEAIRHVGCGDPKITEPPAHLSGCRFGPSRWLSCRVTSHNPSSFGQSATGSSGTHARSRERKVAGSNSAAGLFLPEGLHSKGVRHGEMSINEGKKPQLERRKVYPGGGRLGDRALFFFSPLGGSVVWTLLTGGGGTGRLWGGGC